VRRGRRRRVLIGALALLAILAVVIFAADRILFGGPSGPPGAPVQVRIPEGSSVEHIGDILDDAGVVGNGRRWALDVRLHGDGGGLRAGTYTLRENERYGIILSTARALGEFGAVAIVSGKISGRTETLTLYVEDRFQSLDLAGAYAAALVLALIAVAVLALMTILQRKHKEH